MTRDDFEFTTDAERLEAIDMLIEAKADDSFERIEAELSEVRDAIEDHELNVLQRRRRKLEVDLHEASQTRYRRISKAQNLLAENCPQLVFDIQAIIGRAHSQHCVSDPPFATGHTGEPGEWMEQREAWLARGAALNACNVALRDMASDTHPIRTLAALVEKHRAVLPELRHVQIQIPTRETAEETNAKSTRNRSCS